MEKSYLFKKYPKTKKVYQNLIMNSDIQGLVVVNFKTVHREERISKHSIKKAVKQLYHSHLLNAVDLSNHAYTIPKVTKGFIKAMKQIRQSSKKQKHTEMMANRFEHIAQKSSQALSRSNHDIRKLLIDLKKHKEVIAKLKSNRKAPKKLAKKPVKKIEPKQFKVSKAVKKTAKHTIKPTNINKISDNQMFTL